MVCEILRTFKYAKLPNVLYYSGEVLAFAGIVISLFADHWVAWVKYVIVSIAFVLAMAPIYHRRYCNRVDDIVCGLKDEIGCYIKNGKTKKRIVVIDEKKESEAITEYDNQIEKLKSNQRIFKRS